MPIMPDDYWWSRLGDLRIGDEIGRGDILGLFLSWVRGGGDGMLLMRRDDGYPFHEMTADRDIDEMIERFEDYLTQVFEEDQGLYT